MQNALKPMKAQQDFGPNYSKKNIIGSGSYGDVYEAVNKQTGRIVAIKQFKRLFDNKFIALRALREVTLLRVINYPKIIKIYEILPPKDDKKFDSLAVVLQYMPIDLKKICEKNVALDDYQIENILYQLVVALKYLKQAKILHRDLKPENILISKDLTEVKICDFGLARPIIAYEQPKKVDPLILDSLKEEGEHDKQEEKKQQKANQMTYHVVTRWYRAPEIILLQSQYGNAIEMWSVGCIFAELINIHIKNKTSFFSYKPIFEGKACFPLSPPKKQLVDTYKNFNGFPHSEDDQISKIINVIGTPDEEDIEQIKDQYARAYIKSFPKRARKKIQTLFSYSKPEWIEFLDRALVFNPKKRMTIQQALQHPIFKNIRNKELEVEATEAFANLSLHSGLSMEEIRAKFLEEIKYHQNKVMVNES